MAQKIAHAATLCRTRVGWLPRTSVSPGRQHVLESKPSPKRLRVVCRRRRGENGIELPFHQKAEQRPKIRANTPQQPGLVAVRHQEATTRDRRLPYHLKPALQLIVAKPADLTRQQQAHGLH